MVPPPVSVSAPLGEAALCQRAATIGHAIGRGVVEDHRDAVCKPVRALAPDSEAAARS